jgi:hypothetical protein
MGGGPPGIPGLDIPLSEGGTWDSSPPVKCTTKNDIRLSDFFRRTEMTHEIKGQLSKKHFSDRKISERVAALVKTKATDGAMACAVAFDFAESPAVSAEEVLNKLREAGYDTRPIL